MAWKGVHISRPARLSVKDHQLFASQDDGDVALPLEDIAYIVLDTVHITMTGTLLSACMEHGVAVIVSDHRHSPNGVMLPFHSHHRQAAIAAMQVALSEPFKKRCWQRIVTAKIANQAAHLVTAECEGGQALLAMSQRVGSGDPDNMEARAARDYWGYLFVDFIRDNSTDLRNALMNYGYAIVRSALSRALVACGLLPCFGLHHASVTNSFNLADDMIEPFRPFVDAVARRAAEGRPSKEEMTVADRRAMSSVLMETAMIGGESTTLLIACEKVTESLARAMESNAPAFLILPSFMKEP